MGVNLEFSKVFPVLFYSVQGFLVFRLVRDRELFHSISGGEEPECAYIVGKKYRRIVSPLLRAPE
mgnify:CR=1 FL=1